MPMHRRSRPLLVVRGNARLSAGQVVVAACSQHTYLRKKNPRRAHTPAGNKDDTTGSQTQKNKFVVVFFYLVKAKSCPSVLSSSRCVWYLFDGRLTDHLPLPEPRHGKTALLFFIRTSLSHWPFDAARESQACRLFQSQYLPQLHKRDGQLESHGPG